MRTPIWTAVLMFVPTVTLGILVGYAFGWWVAALILGPGIVISLFTWWQFRRRSRSAR